MAFTQAQLDALEEAIAQGVLEVKYQDREVRYRSMNQMLQLRDLMRRSLGKAPKSSRIHAKFKKGTC